MPNFLELRGLKSQDITHDAQLIKAVPIDDTEKAADKVLAYDQPADKLVYVPKCPEIVIKAIQHILINIPTPDLSTQILINEVDLDNTFLIWAGCSPPASQAQHALARIDFLDSTHIRAIRNTIGVDVTVNLCIIECTAGIKSIQRGTIVLTSELHHDATITEVDTDKTFVSHLGASTTTFDFPAGLVNIHLYDSTTVRAYHIVAPGTVTVSYEVIEFI
ncbi:hypothetical protein ES703_11076 [subsurface metagenome]